LVDREDLSIGVEDGSKAGIPLEHLEHEGVLQEAFTL
jgi:hypothetical protein